MQTQYKKYITTLTFSILSVLFPSTIYAETHITNGYLYEGGSWTKEGSPYILEDYVTVPIDQKLFIGPGVSIKSSSLNEDGRLYDIQVKGDLDISGSEKDSVRIIDIGEIFLGKDNKIAHAILENTSLYANFGTTTITSSKISGASVALNATKSFIDIRDSEITHNTQGILSNPLIPGPFLMYNSEENAIGGLGNALDIDPEQNIITITNTILEDNGNLSIQNKTANAIQASDNWWGNANGPGSTVVGPVIVDPWKTKDPRLVEIKPLCCSNVLFLPGLEASRLFRLERGIFGTSTNRLWEPNRNDDVRKLYLNEDGSSKDPSIYTSGIIESAFGIKGIYNKFVAMMNGVVADKTINEWLPLAYDWRMGIEDIVSDNVIKEVEGLASTSRTGKVTIIAHSNGGLVAKMIGKKLEEQGKTNIIDKVIFTAVPQLGTPEAVAAMLHGDSQALIGGLVLSSGVARTLGLNMQGAYGLLPSEEYIKRFVDPIITLADQAIDSYSSLKEFLLGENDNRTQPAEGDMKKPAVLKGNLLSKAQWMHSLIDNWQFPFTAKVMSIVGWGVPTIQTVEYGSTTPRLKKNSEGDGTVLASSAASYGGNVLYLNQGQMTHDNSERHKNPITHADILESDSILHLISNSIATSSPSPLPQYITSQKPNTSDYPWMSWLTVSVHSPVDIDVYDNHGGHIGLVPLPTDPDSDIKWLENTIGGQYEAIGDEKYITIPADDSYSVQMKGTGYGTFTFDVQKFVGGNMIEVASTTYADLPVTPLLAASTTVNSLIINSPLALDVDGNGSTDIKVGPNLVMNPSLHLDSMKTIILSLHLKPALESNLLKKLERVRVLIKKDKTDKAIKRIKTISQKIENRHWNIKKLTESDKLAIVNMFDVLLDNLEKD